MIEALAVAGGIGTVGALIAVIVMAFRLSSAKDAVIALKGINAEQKIEASQIQAKLVNERDTALTRAGTLAAEVADRDVKITGLEKQLAESAAKVARLTVKLAATLPVGPDGADAVNSIFADPLPGKEPKKP